MTVMARDMHSEHDYSVVYNGCVVLSSHSSGITPTNTVHDWKNAQAKQLLTM